MTKDIATVKAALEYFKHRVMVDDWNKPSREQHLEVIKAAARAYVETALSSPPAIDLEGLKAEAHRKYIKYACGNADQCCFESVSWVIDHLAATGKLGGDDLGELLKRVPEGEILCFGADKVVGGFNCKVGASAGNWVHGTTPAEAVRKAMEKMEEGE